MKKCRLAYNTRQVAEMIGSTSRRVTAACVAGELQDAFLLGEHWHIPHQTVYDLTQKPVALRNILNMLDKR